MIKLTGPSTNIWFTSDTHYNHKGIVRGTTSWEEKRNTRDFDKVEEHNKALIANFNHLVKEDDVLFHLGDWSFGGFKSIREFREQLKCKNIHLIFGNHDHHIVNNKENIREIFSSVDYYKEVSYNGQMIVMSHYAMRVWNQSHKGAWMLYGHSHGTLDKATPEISNPTWIGDQYYIKNWRTMDVGVDTNHLRPYNLATLNKTLAHREVLLEVDHHTAETN